MPRSLAFSALVLLLATACDRPDFSPRAPEAAHGSSGPNGGGLVELGDHAYVLEAKIDHDRGLIAVWLFTHSMTPQAADGPPEITWGTDSKRMSFAGEPREGSGSPAAAWTFQHEDFELEPQDPKLRLAIGGKRFEVEVPHHH